MADLSADGIAAVDAADQISDILSLPEHMTDALWRVESAGLSEWDSPGGMVVAGMGSSSIGGALARAVLGDHCIRPMTATRGYGLPGWTTPDTTVLCASYSGDTEETLAAYDAAGALGARRVVVTAGGRLAEIARRDDVPVIPLPGGFPPRVTVGYMTVAALEAAALCGVGHRMASDIDVAVGHLEHLCGEWHPEVDEGRNTAKKLARALHGTIPVIVGAGLTVPVAYRWKTQINQNAKMPAFSHDLPELDHNELAGWGNAEAFGRFSAVFLGDADNHPRIADRIQLTCELIDDDAAGTFQLETLGQSTVERVMSLVLLGDLLSLYLAVLQDVDPTPVGIIDDLKARLAQRT